MIFALSVSLCVLAVFNLVLVHFQQKFNDEVIATFKANHQVHEALMDMIKRLNERANHVL